VHVVPFGVSARPTLTPFASRAGLAFIGGYDHTPNVDAAFWLAGQIMPEVAALDADIKCLLVGSAMPRHVRALGSETIEPLGAVDDLAFVFDRVRLTVAPLNFGAGVKGKVLESLAAGIPCVCTPVAAEGMDLPDPLSQLVAGEPGAIAALILRLHTDAAFNAACAEAGKVYIAARNSPDAIDAAMRPAIGPAPSAMPQADAQATRSA
jgi:glycosyltransferase involved in cell wall biosynthesis